MDVWARSLVWGWGEAMKGEASCGLFVAETGESELSTMGDCGSVCSGTVACARFGVWAGMDCQVRVQNQQGRMRSLAATRSQTRCLHSGERVLKRTRATPIAAMRRVDCQRKGQRISSQAVGISEDRSNQGIGGSPWMGCLGLLLKNRVRIFNTGQVHEYLPILHREMGKPRGLRVCGVVGFFVAGESRGHGFELFEIVCGELP